MRPYIGITDVPSYEWLCERLLVFKKAGGDEIDRQLHAGVMMSYKSLTGVATKYDAVWPKNHDIAKIFAMHHVDVLNVLHYADYGGQTTLQDLKSAVRYGGHNLDALQLDMPWPDPEMIAGLVRTSPTLRIILQVGTEALGQILHDPNTLLARLQRYSRSVTDVLLDQSGGKGAPMAPSHLLPFIRALRTQRRDLGVTVAGGLGPDTLNLVAPLVREYPSLSIDAQGQLRHSGRSVDPIDTERADTYLRRAVAMFKNTIPDGAPI